jgi:DNA polymerase (family X)
MHASNENLNTLVAGKLLQYAELLEQQGATFFRIKAYREGAETLRQLQQDVREIFDQQGMDGLVALPHIGQSIARVIKEILQTGKWAQLDRLLGTLEPEKIFQNVPGIGPSLAHTIYEKLHIDSLEALETAAHDGRLVNVKGIGPRRLTAIRLSLASLLSRRSPNSYQLAHRPSVGDLLDVDQEYRSRSASGNLPVIVPKRFNSSGTRKLPILHTDRNSWHFTAIFSNTTRAQQLDRVKDWVVIYYYKKQEPEGQCTVVTERRGVLRGFRVVRGREHECQSYYSHCTLP